MKNSIKYGTIFTKNSEVEEEMEKTLLLVDGSNLLFQMFFGMPTRIVNKEGKPIHGTLGFVGALLKIIRMVHPTHVVVIFDGEHENNRVLIDENYKSNRPDYSKMSDDETPFSQLPDIYSALDILGVKYAETSVCEADDVIAAYTFKYSADFGIIVSSFDSDFFQLISKKVNVLRYRGDKTVICDEKYITDKFGVLPCQYADFKALVGDTSDNIRGADKIGVKTASKLLNEFGTIQSIIDNCDKIRMPSIRASIEASVDRLINNQQLIKLSDNSPIPFGVDDLLYSYNGITTGEVLSKIGLK